MTKQIEYSWMTVARAEINQKEVSGAKHNPRIIQYHAATTLRATTDEIPWCSSFVNWCLQTAGVPITRSAAARSWLKYGEQSEIQYGAIVVLSRGDDPKAGHVGFVDRVTRDRVFVLGGNQGDAVNVRSFARSRVIDCRMPKDASKYRQTSEPIV